MILIELCNLQGEDIFKAAVREVKEETNVSDKCLIMHFTVNVKLCFQVSHSSVGGLSKSWFLLLQIDTEFVEILGFRYNISDIFTYTEPQSSLLSIIDR